MDPGRQQWLFRQLGHLLPFGGLQKTFELLASAEPTHDYCRHFSTSVLNNYRKAHPLYLSNKYKLVKGCNCNLFPMKNPSPTGE